MTEIEAIKGYFKYAIEHCHFTMIDEVIKEYEKWLLSIPEKIK